MRTELPDSTALSLTEPDATPESQLDAVTDGDADAFDPATLRFVTRGVTHSEAAAVTAVLRGLLREESDRLRKTPSTGQSAWQRAQRSIRSPLTPGPGRWNNFPS